MNNNRLKVKINNQKYLKCLIINNPKLTSGRKFYESHYLRILKTLLLIKIYTNKKNNLFNKFLFTKKKYLSIKEIDIDKYYE